MGNHPSPSDKASIDCARQRAEGAFRAMVLVFAGGFAALAIVAFIATKEVAVVFLVAFIFFGIVVCGWFGQRWLLRNMDDG